MTVPSDSARSYIVVTPVKDEERYVARTLESVTSQTVRPLRWVLVDDGSTDSTPEIIQEYVRTFDWISYVRINRTTERKLGTAEVWAFTIGYESVRELDHGFVVKLDADLLLPPDYFEQMLRRFRDNPKLGIASGLYLEDKSGRWFPTPQPPYHAVGAAKMARVACFNAISGFPTSPGWDTADEIKAWARGWETTHFPDIQFYHLKPEGSADGPLETSRYHGQIYYICGGGKLFLLGKVLHRMIAGKPFLLSGLMLLYGYLHSAATGRAKLVTSQEEACYKRLLNRRIIAGLTGSFSLHVLKT